MLVFGDSLIPFEDIVKIYSIEDISKTKSNSKVLFDYEEELLKYCYLNNIDYFVVVCSIKEAIYASNLGARYIVCRKEISKKLQKIADNYMFDSKILTIIKSNDEFENVALKQIDGAIYKELV